MRQPWALVPALTTLLVGTVLVVGAHAVWPAPACGPDEIAAQAEEQGPSDAVHVVVLSSSNKGPLMAEMACRFERTEPTIDGRPLDIQIESESSGTSIDKISGGATQPDVWAPASSSWARMLALDQPTWIPSGELPSIAQSPQVIAMPRPLATDLGWPDDQIGWQDILGWANDPDQWDAVAGPDSGDFKLGKTNPLFSTSGLNATVATYQAVTGTSSDLTKAELRKPSVLDFVKGVDSAVVHYAPTSVEFLRNLRAQDELGLGDQYVSAVLLEEKSVWDYNQGNPSGDPATLGDASAPKTPLVAFYPHDGALVADHPYVILTGGWVTDERHAGAQAFLDFLLAPDQQERFQELGYRDHTGVPGPEIDEANGLIAAEPTSVKDPPEGDVLAQIRDDWPEYRKRARVLILLDVSGSMRAEVPGTGQTKLELAKTAAQQALTQLGDDDEVGLWTFTPSPSTQYVENVPIDPLSRNREALERAIEGLKARGGTKLNATVEAAAATMQAAFDPTKINGIILLSDGKDDGTDDASSVISAVTPPSSDREVRVFTIAYGDSADVDALADIALASFGTAYDATDAATIEQVFYQVVANF